MLVSIEGNIGSGKSTLVKKLREKFSKEWNFLGEPVDEWLKLKDDQGKSLIELFYEDKQRYSYTFQNYAYITRIRKLMETSSHNINITERCVLTDKNVFAKMLIDDGYMNKMEQQMYDDWFDFFKQHSNVDIVIYIKTEPEECKRRIDIRSREGENIDMNYLNRLNEYHEKWISSMSEDNVLVLDGHTDFNENPEAFIQEIETFIVKKTSPKNNTDAFSNLAVFC